MNRLFPDSACAEERPRGKNLTSSGDFKSYTGMELSLPSKESLSLNLPINCAEARPRGKNLTSSGDFKSYTGRELSLHSKESLSLNLPIKRSISIQTGSASSTCSGPLLRQGPLSSSPLPLLVSSSPSVATSGHRKRRECHHQLIETFSGRVVSRWKPSGRAEPVMQEHPDVNPYDVPSALTDSESYRTQNGGWAGARASVPPSCQVMPFRQSLQRSMASSSSGFPASRPSTISQQGCPLVECRGASLLVPSPTRHDLPSPVTGIGSLRSGTNLNLSHSSSNCQGRLLCSPPLQTQFTPSRGGNGQLHGSQVVDEFPLLNLKENQSLCKPSSVSRCNALSRSCRLPAQNPCARFSKLESE